MSKLNSLFSGTACKYLSAVDATAKSNQHEIGSNKFKVILGDPGGTKLRFDAAFVLFSESSDESLNVNDTVTYYDSRFANPNRGQELRLYYRDNAVTEKIKEGDFCLVAKCTNERLLIAFAPVDSVHERRLRHLFKLNISSQEGWTVEPQTSSEELSLASRSILDALGLDVPESGTSQFEELLEPFGMIFPKTSIFSLLARNATQIEVDPLRKPDETLEEWMRIEEILFKTLENKIVKLRIDQGFNSVEDFVSFSLSVQNRRKSRAGHALENHLEAIFIANKVKFQRGAKTEGNAKPDFLFPDAISYHDINFDAKNLRMLAAKSTCKDRWRQILIEAARIKVKHLFTLETAISSNQTDEMVAHNVQLIVPPSVAGTYSETQQKQLLSLSEFIQVARSGQN